MGTYSKLHEDTYQQIKSKFPEFYIRENLHPDWLLSSNLTKLEIDIYIETIDTAIEIQGLQHYEYVPYFHRTYANFIAQQQRDNEKRDLCLGHGTRLVEIACYADLNSFIYDLEKEQKTPDQYSYSIPGNHGKGRQSKPYKKSAMRNPGYRSWKKRQILKKKKALFRLDHPLPPIVIKPGSQKMRHRAKWLLKSEKISEATWKVWGGEADHIVVQTADIFTCDCNHYKDTGTICSHIIKVSYPDLV